MEVWDDLGTLRWYVAADDRWHVPDDEPSVRQIMVEGTPVIETRVRIPSGDAVQRVYAVADHDGLTVVEVENDSPLPIAVAFAGVPVLSVRTPTDMAIQGIDLPEGAVVFPVGHHASLTVAIAHSGARTGVLPAPLPPAGQVSRGWLALCERAGRLLLPDATLSEAVVRERCQLLLDGPAHTTDRPVEFLLGVDQLVRMGSQVDPWIPEVADAVHALSSIGADPLLAAAFDAAVRICTAADETRALKDLAKLRPRLIDQIANTGRVAPDPAHGVRLLAAVERLVATGPDLFPGGVPVAWLGQNFEVYGVPTGPSSTVSFAVRWHGERPAVLWECSGQPVILRSSGAAPGWSTADVTGEALWPVPAGAVPAMPLDASPPDISFS